MANSVIKFSVDAQGNLQRNGYYNQGQLHKQSVTQDGQETNIYKDAFGRELAKVQNDNGKKWFTYTVYDGYGRVAMILPPEASDRLIPPNAVSADIIAKYAYRYVYDGFGRVITKYLPGCEAIEYVYDKGGRVIVTVDGEMNTLFTEYDVMGRSVRTSMVQLNTDLATLRRYPETVNSRVTVLKTLAEYRYDNADNRNLVFQANPIVSSNLLSPSDKGRLVYEKQYVLDDDTYLERNFFYDTHGRLIQTVERDASDYLHTYTTQYDFVGNVLKNSEEHKIGSKTDSKLTENTYDSYSRLLSSKTTVNNGTPATVRFTYNDLGQLENTTYGTSQTLTERYAYNIQGWKIQTASSKFSLNLHYFDAKYATPCHNGNIAEMDWLQSGQPLKTYAFTYDKLNRLTSSALYENNTLTSRYEEKSLTYDGQGNILTLIRTNENSVETTYNYTYNGNQLTTLTQNSTAYSYTYDDKGNMEHDGRKNLDFTYNVVNLPSVVKKNNTVVAQYRYLANGTKLSVKGADGKGYSYMGSMIYTNNNGVLALESTDFAGGRIYATNNTTEAHYHLSDHLGSPRVILNESMDILEQNDYYPFGMRHANAQMVVSNNRFRYNGKEEQQIGGLDVLDYGWRQLDPALGRWHCVDNLAEMYFSTSPYAYCGNNPIMRVDVDGNVWTPAGQAWADDLDDEMTRQTTSQQNKINNTQAKINAGGLSQKKLDRLNNRLANQQQTLGNMNTEFAQTRTELAAMGDASAQVYNVVEDASLNAPRVAGQANGEATGKTVYNTQTGAVDIRIPTLDNQLMFFAHEAKHGYQFEMGETSIKLWTADGEQNARGALGVDLLLYDWSDEQAAYSRGGYFGQRTPAPYAGVPQGPVDFRTHPQNNILTGGNAQLIRNTAQQYRMAIRVPVNGVRTTFW